MSIYWSLSNSYTLPCYKTNGNEIIKPIGSIFDYCASYIKEEYEDWDK